MAVMGYGGSAAGNRLDGEVGYGVAGGQPRESPATGGTDNGVLGRTTVHW